MYDWLDDAAAGGVTVITSSRRLARDLRAVHDARHAAAGQSAWHTPAVLFWRDWLSGLLDDARAPDAPVLLPEAAATLLWERCLYRTSPAGVLGTGAILAHARRAWRRIVEWGVPLETLAKADGNADQRWFARAAAAYERRLRSGNWIDEPELPACVTGLLAAHAVPPPERLTRAGFERIVPALATLFDTLSELGCEVTDAPSPSPAGGARTLCYPDAAAEWRAAGAFARRRLEEDPAARVAIVAPDLESDADTIARLVREGLAPGWQIGSDRHRASVDVSWGRRLADFPVVAVALLALAWLHRGLTGSEVSVLLRSPFVGGDDLDGRCRLERYLRTLPDRQWSAPDFLAACRESRRDSEGGDWQRRMALVAALAQEASATAEPAEWARRIDELLARLGWPGIDAPDSDEFQLINRWRQLLNELARVEVVWPTMTLGAAVRRVTRIAADAVHQPEARPGAVHLLGMPEAAGMEFDHLWIGGLEAARWPPPSRPLALLPRPLQQAWHMPDATPGDTLEFARRVFDRRRRAAPSVTLSWPRADEDAALAPSPFLGDAAPAESPVAGDDPGWFAATLIGARGLETLEDGSGPPVTGGEKVRGGAYAVQRQHEEPFSAFALGRLGIDDLEDFQRGLSSRQRGIVLHRALYGLLAERPTRAAMAGWGGPDLEARIERAIDGSLRGFRRLADEVLARLLAVEARRLQSLLREFVAAEVGREAFSVASLEDEIPYRHGALELSLRIDRVDRLADGSLLIVDYKSGRERSLLNARGEPADMQLGVYARAVDEPVGGLLLLGLDSRAIRYDGVGGSVPWGRVRASAWPALRDAWFARVDELLAQLADGDLRQRVRPPDDRSRALGVLSRTSELRRGE